MLAPLRDYLRPPNPKSSRTLCTTKDHYFSRLSIYIDPSNPGFGETQWIMSEGVNVEHLLDVFTTIDANSDDVWNACANFMDHLYWHKPHLVVLGAKTEGLPDDRPPKPRCLLELSRLLDSIGNRMETKRLLTHAWELWRERGDEQLAGRTLAYLSEANCQLNLHKEGIPQAEEALKICERLGGTLGQMESLQRLTRLLYEDNQLDAAEEAASRAVGLSSDEGDQFRLCGCHRLLGNIFHSKGEVEKAIEHIETALGIASSFNWREEQFWSHYELARSFLDEGRFDDAHTHIEHSGPHAVDDTYKLGRTAKLRAKVLHWERRLEEAKSEVSRAIEVFEKLGAAQDLEKCKRLLEGIQEEISDLGAVDESDGEDASRNNAITTLINSLSLDWNLE